MNASCQPRRAQPWAAGTRRLLLASIVALGAAQSAASNLSANWRLNGNGYPGEVMLQQAADGTLSGTIYGNPLSGFHSAGDRNVVWLRGAPTQPDQAFVGSVSADGNAIIRRRRGSGAQRVRLQRTARGTEPPRSSGPARGRRRAGQRGRHARIERQ